MFNFNYCSLLGDKLMFNFNYCNLLGDKLIFIQFYNKLMEDVKKLSKILQGGS